MAAFRRAQDGRECCPLLRVLCRSVPVVSRQDPCCETPILLDYGTKSPIAMCPVQ